MCVCVELRYEGVQVCWCDDGVMMWMCMSDGYGSVCGCVGVIVLMCGSVLA